jgi:hypothetical protein
MTDGECEELLQFWQDKDFEVLIDVGKSSRSISAAHSSHHKFQYPISLYLTTKLSWQISTTEPGILPNGTAQPFSPSPPLA